MDWVAGSSATSSAAWVGCTWGAWVGVAVGPRKGESTIKPLVVSLEDLYNGKTSKLQLTKKALCPTCQGKGSPKEVGGDRSRRRHFENYASSESNFAHRSQNFPNLNPGRRN